MGSANETERFPWHRVESTLLSTARCIRTRYDAAFAPLDLNLTSASLLMYVVEQGATSQTALADVVDIGRATEELHSILSGLNFQNLDEVAEFEGQNTTTEFLARVIFDRMVASIGKGDLGPNASGLTAMKVTLNESHVAWAAYEGTVGADEP